MNRLAGTKHKEVKDVNNKTNDEHRYDDIINLPRHQSPTRPRMPLIDRAAQFSPFAALTGYDETIKETVRPVDERIMLEEDAIAKLNEQFKLLHSKIEENPFVLLTYFVPDEKKDGGKYITVSGNVKKIDEYEKVIILQDEIKIPINEIIGISIEFETDKF